MLIMKKKLFIIAEAGVNHNGDLELAKQLIDAAVAAGADAVKFQTFKANELVGEEAPKADYQRVDSGGDETQLAMLQRLEISEGAHQRLVDYCDDREVMFLSTPFDLASVDFLNSLGLPIFKIPSGELTNLPYLRKIGALGKRIFLSTGMSNLEEVRKAVEELERASSQREDITVLHANTQYPTPFEDVNLKAMETLGRELGLAFGYSDHTLGIEVPIAAAAMGAVVIEKHFTLNREMPGPDHKASLEPGELKAMVRSIRNIEQALGDGIKRVSASERGNIVVTRKSIVAAQAISEGDIFTEENLTTKRPASGVSPMRWDEVIGKKARRAYGKGAMIDA